MTRSRARLKKEWKQEDIPTWNETEATGGCSCALSFDFVDAFIFFWKKFCFLFYFMYYMFLVTKTQENVEVVSEELNKEFEDLYLETE